MLKKTKLTTAIQKAMTMNRSQAQTRSADKAKPKAIVKIKGDENTVRVEPLSATREFEIISNNDENRTIEVVFSTGQSGKRYDWWEDEYYMEDLEISHEAIISERLDKGLSVLDSHNRDSVLGVYGVTEAWRIENKQLIGTVRFAKDPESDLIYQKVKDKVLRHVSLGYDVLEYTRTEKVGEMMQLTATSWSPTELSFVPVSFETTNGVRSKDDQTLHNVKIKSNEESPMLTKEQKARLALLQSSQNRSIDEHAEMNVLLTMSGQPTVERKADPAPAIAPTEKPVKIETVNRQADLGIMLKAVDSAGLDVEFATRHFSQGTSVHAFREAVIDQLAVNSAENRANPTLKADNREDHASNVRKNAEIAIMQRSGHDVEGTTNLGGHSIFEIAREMTKGASNKGLSRHAVAERAFHSTSDFPLILANVMNKSLLAGYAEVEQTFRDLGSKTTVNDFREKHTYRLGDAPKLLPLGEGGEYKAGTFSESGEKYGISTFARKIAFTRQMLINDDMSALNAIPQMFGRSGAELESDVVWGLLLGYDFLNNKAKPVVMSDGKGLFDSAHKNLLTGASSAVSKDALSELRKLGRKQKSLDGKFMNVRFSELVIPEDIETELEALLLGNILATKTADVNQFSRTMQMRVEPRLSQVSQTSWYAFSKAIPTFEYATLAGEENMVTEIAHSTDIDGMQLNCRKDFGAGLIDWRGVAKAVGA